MWQKLKNGIIFNKTPVRILLFSDSSILTMQKFIQNTNSKYEAGGIILGEVKGEHIYVTDVSSPKKMTFVKVHTLNVKIKLISHSMNINTNKIIV